MLAHMKPIGDAAAPAPVAPHWSEPAQSYIADGAPRLDLVEDKQAFPPLLEGEGPGKHVKPGICEPLSKRPHTYTPEIGRRLVDIMSKGYSLTAACAALSFTMADLHRWKAFNPQIEKDVFLGKGRRLLFWENQALDVAQSGGIGSQSTMIIYGLNNQGTDEWRNKREVEHSGQVTLQALLEQSIGPPPGAGLLIEGSAESEAESEPGEAF